MSSPSQSSFLSFCLKESGDFQEEAQKDDIQVPIVEPEVDSVENTLRHPSHEHHAADPEDQECTAINELLSEPTESAPTMALSKATTKHAPPVRNMRIQKVAKKVDRQNHLRKVAQDTLRAMPAILQATINKYPQNSYLADEKTAPPLVTSSPYYPDFQQTHVKVVRSDTLDAALTLHNAHEIFKSEDTKPVCVLNFANAEKAGGGWTNGRMAQEEEICYRSTLSQALHSRFYPMAKRECIYSPNVIIFRENDERGHSFMWTNKPELLPVVSVVTMAATMKPKLDKSVNPPQYKDDAERVLMEDKMRMILRVTADNHHRRLVLGALGCGVFEHHPQQVADCWKKVLQEKEFKGWFEMVLFAVMDKENGLNFISFKNTLENLQM